MASRFGRLCGRLCCCSSSGPDCSESQPLTHASEDDDDPPALTRRSSLWERWERARSRLRTLVKLEQAAAIDGYEDSLPRCVLAYEHRVELLPLLPATLRHRQWKLLYSVADHGCSIRTLLGRASGCGPTIVLVRDARRHVFGAFAAEAWRKFPEPHFYGSGEAFLFTTWPDGFRAFSWSGANRYCQAAAIDFVAFGSGGHFGLWLGKSLRTGSTGRCETFENDPLTEHAVHGGLSEPFEGDSAFEVLELQVWGFAAWS